MLKKRIIPIQLLIDGRLVKTKQFDSYRDVGDPVASSRVYSAQNADELVFLNINRGERSIEPLLPLLERVSEVCFMPLTLGGGLRRLGDAEVLIRHGADKVVVNSQIFRTPGLIEQIAGKFGSQAVIVSIDARRDPQSANGESANGSDYSVWSDCGRVREAISLDVAVDTALQRGAGEILVTSIDRDGTMSGFDLDLVKRVTERSPIPVIAGGGAGNYEHMRSAFQATSVSALAVGSLFNFGDNNPIRAKAHLSNHGIRFKVV